jgi:HAD superfamily hydrolase (TIGR01549 family)
MKKIVVYDCDGVLFDSTEAVLAYYDFVCDTFKIKKIDRTDQELVNKAMMRTNEEILNLLTDDKALINEMLEFAKNMNFQKFLKYMKPEENIYETLEKLKEKNYIINVFTNRGHSLHYLLEEFNMDKYFEYKVTSFDVENPKPSPEGLYKIMEKYNVKKDDLIYIGDTTNDYYASKSAEVDFIGYKFDYSDCICIDNHLEILKYL